MDNEKKLVGVFTDEQEAIRAIEGLKRQGYRSDEISVITKNRDDARVVEEETGSMAPEGVATGAAAGGMLGGAAGLLAGIGALTIPGIGPILAAGPIVATLTGAAVGAGAGSLVGGLIGLGFSETDARQYNEYLDEGRILVLVPSRNEHDHDVYDTFRSNNTLNASTYEIDAGATPGGSRSRY
ncbi:low temperature-induced protein [Paenibacillus hemerocallicola]|uniref:Low temperature-induced protein n=1 Tax=Paenibacillus hemerocallicola TaxID=1172614 RepID=A0A5C4TD57_9BACL|nr:general stress protein [Paenibacillus hemerocallicola]TNJ66470.1 low temperature-induced protein [Paenibacillus hemerocallicola]